MKKQIAFFIFFFFLIKSYSQVNFLSPIRQLVLVSTFGELRPDHFHSGVDFSGFHRIGMPVYAIDSGYISRISVSADGYGNAIYITHYNGLKSVYGHLDRFSDSIQDFVQRMQYKLKQFEIMLYPEPFKFKVRRGQIIGYVGNTGRSYAPHLHFEIRDALFDYPINPLLYYNLPDTRPPVINKIAVYPASDTSMINYRHRRLVLPATKRYTVKIYGPVFFGVEAYDYVDNHPSRKGVYSVKLFIDDTLRLWYQFDRFLFQNTRYVNALLDYADYLRHKWKIQRSYITPNNRLCIYKFRSGNGVFNLSPGKHKVEYLVADIKGNKRSFVFFVDVMQHLDVRRVKPDGRLLLYSKSYDIDTAGISIHIPSWALYDTIYFKFSVDKKSVSVYNSLSPVYNVHTPFTPLQQPITLRITIDTNVTDPDKLLIVYIDYRGKLKPLNTEVVSRLQPVPSDVATEMNFERPYYVGKTVLQAQSYNFGRFFVALDTVKPTIIFLSKVYRDGFKILRFKLKDNLSGIGRITVLADDRWHLYAFDAKTSTLTVKISADYNSLRLIVSDKKDNVTVRDFSYLLK